MNEAAFETDADVTCPHCGERVSIGLDPGSGGTQTYVEDCPVCCRPWQVRVRFDANGGAEVWVEPAS